MPREPRQGRGAGPGPDYGSAPPGRGRERPSAPPDGHVNDDIDLEEIDPGGRGAARAKALSQGADGGGRTGVIALSAVGALLLAVAAYSAHSSSPAPAQAGAVGTPGPSTPPTTLPPSPATTAPSPAASSPAASSPPSASPSTVAINDAAVKVAVFNGGGVNGRAGSLKSALVADGFSMATVGGTVAKTATTKIFFPQGRSDSAAAVARALGVPSANVVQSTAYAEVTLIVGTDWSSGNTYPDVASPTSTP
jgi:hypothetical protein